MQNVHGDDDINRGEVRGEIRDREYAANDDGLMLNRGTMYYKKMFAETI